MRTAIINCTLCGAQSGESCRPTRSDGTMGLPLKHIHKSRHDRMQRIEQSEAGSLEKMERIVELKREAKAWRNLSKLLDKLLVCYRVSRNPGSLLDKIDKARKAVKTHEA